METVVFYRPEILRELKRFVEVRLHTDGGSEESRTLLRIKTERFQGDVTTPIYEIVDPGNKKGEERRRGVFLGADLWGERFLEFLKRSRA